jgi:hypothetical protein
LPAAVATSADTFPPTRWQSRPKAISARNPVGVIEVYSPAANAWTTAAGPPETLAGQGYANGQNRLTLLGGVKSKV